MRGKWIEYSDQELFFIKLNCKMNRKDLTSLFNRTFNRDLSVSNIHALCKRKGWLTGRTGQFEKGRPSWNTGSPFSAGGRSEETQFKPGHRPKTWVPIGTEVEDAEGYLKRKIRDDAPKGMSRKNWKYVHVMKWEEFNGKPVPRNHIIRFRDGNKRNFAPENLVLLSRAENAVLNKCLAIEQPTPEGMDALITMAKIKILANKRRKQAV